jgi:hypothetical protein
MRFFLFLLLTGIAPLRAADSPSEPCIKIEESATATELKTVVIHLKKGKLQLDLVGALHIAEASYYEELNQRFLGYDAVLYEGIGSGKSAAPSSISTEKPVEKPTSPAASQNLSGLHGIYDAYAKALELSYQMEKIDYSQPNFVHADLSYAQFQALQKERGESILGFFARAGLSNLGKQKSELEDWKTLIQWARGDKSALKLQAMRSLGDSEDILQKVSENSVIIGDRNDRCLSVLQEQIGAGKRRLAIFYGAGHFRDMLKKLTAQGWQQQTTEWLTAWKVAKKPQKP